MCGLLYASRGEGLIQITTGSRDEGFCHEPGRLLLEEQACGSQRLGDGAGREPDDGKARVHRLQQWDAVALVL